MTTASPHPGSEHLLVLPDRDAAERIAEDLRDEGFEQVRVVREAAATEDDDEAHEWAVHVLDTRLPDSSGGGAYEGLRERFTELVAEHDGWYDEPGDPRPPAPRPPSP
ncbi:ribonuclease E inhibitor RraB [Ornithinimicrobium sp. LYQ121]|uniref:ribonuclease E inhibitor RraB n=1 Tax=Ornithinimicrobium sp. LYQ121 TaxID=3378801 RepID=UPI003852AEED